MQTVCLKQVSTPAACSPSFQVLLNTPWRESHWISLAHCQSPSMETNIHLLSATTSHDGWKHTHCLIRSPYCGKGAGEWVDMQVWSSWCYPIRSRKEFESHLFEEVCLLLGMEKIQTTPYHQSDELVEWFNRTSRMLMTVRTKPSPTRHLAPNVDACLPLKCVREYLVMPTPGKSLPR